MSKLDLHGVRHIDVDELVEDFILANELPLYIITGNSHVMRDKVIRLLNKHNFQYVIRAHNLGEIVVV